LFFLFSVAFERIVLDSDDNIFFSSDSPHYKIHPPLIPTLIGRFFGKPSCLTKKDVGDGQPYQGGDRHLPADARGGFNITDRILPRPYSP